jgi:hypothetical protein
MPMLEAMFIISEWPSWKQLPIIPPAVIVMALAVIASLYPRILALISTWSFYAQVT